MLLISHIAQNPIHSFAVIGYWGFLWENNFANDEFPDLFICLYLENNPLWRLAGNSFRNQFSDRGRWLRGERKVDCITVLYSAAYYYYSHVDNYIGIIHADPVDGQ